MSARIKVTIAVVLLLVVALGAYYGFGRSGPGGTDTPAPGEAQPADAVGADPGGLDAPSGDQDFSGAKPIFPDGDRDPRGILSESVEQAIGARETISRGVEIPSGVLAMDGQAPGRPRVVNIGPDAEGPAQPVAGPLSFGPASIAANDVGTQATRSSRIKESLSGVAERPFPATPRPVRSSLPPPPRYVDYTVQEDDTMWTIAEQWFGDGVRWEQIATANPFVDPNRLRVGQKLRLPPKGSPRTRVGSSAEQVGAGVVYTVKRGDMLTKIAKAYYSDAGRWRIIYVANRRTIGSNPNRLAVGMRLHIPPRTAPARR